MTAFEDERPGAAAARREVIAALGDAPVGRVVGITGAPGAGKSTLVGALAPALIAGGDALAVVAVDPSSPTSGGAFLGDRTRVRFPPDEPRLYFRSQASRGQLGGLAPSTFHVCRLLARLYDTVLVETVGVGQSEIDVAHVADATWLVIAPHGGDEVQFMKAGLMEVPDGFVLSKDDLGPGAAARRTPSSAPRSAWPAAPTGQSSGPAPAPATASTSWPAGSWRSRRVGSAPARPTTSPAGSPSQLGRAGRARLDAAGGPAAYIAAHGGLDAAELALAAEA